MTIERPMLLPVDSTRRRFLSQAAGVAAGGTVLALATIPRASAAVAPAGLMDPVFSLIEAHQRGIEATNKLFKEQYRLEATLPSELRSSDIDRYEGKIVQTDAPEWIANQKAIAAALEAEADSELELATLIPTTMAGVAALLELASTERDCRWRDLEDEKGMTYSWESIVMRNCAEALTNLSVVSLDHGNSPAGRAAGGVSSLKGAPFNLPWLRQSQARNTASSPL